MDIASFLIFFVGGTLLSLIVIGIAGTAANWKDAETDEVSAIERERGSPTLIARR